MILMALVGVGTAGVGEGRGWGGIVQSGGDRCSHPVNPACNTGERSQHTQAAAAHTDTQTGKDRGEQRDVDRSLGAAEEDHHTPPWGSHMDTVNSWDAYMNMMKCINRQ